MSAKTYKMGYGGFEALKLRTYLLHIPDVDTIIEEHQKFEIVFAGRESQFEDMASMRLDVPRSALSEVDLSQHTLVVAQDHLHPLPRYA